MVTRSPLLFRSRPREEAVSPFPSELATPPVTKMCFVTGSSSGATPATVPQARGAGRDGRRSRPPTGAVDGSQRRDGVDDPGEGHNLAGQVGSHEQGQDPDPCGTPGTGH